MSITASTIEPTTIIAGDFVTWSRSLPDYPAPLYVLSYAIVGSAGTMAVTASADGTDHLIEIEGDSQTGPPAVVGTEDWAAGLYRWTAYVTEVATSRRTTIGTGSLTVEADPATQSATDTRSHARKVVDELERILESPKKLAQQSVTVDGKTLQWRDIDQLHSLLSKYRADVQREDAVASGAAPFASVKFAFTRTS
jgi:hypothetical protein